MKYSKGFDRDWFFYWLNAPYFDFCGTLNPKHEAIYDPNGSDSPKYCFYMIQSQGKNIPTTDPDALNTLLITQAGVNFQIKQWAEGMADGTLLLYEVSQRLWNERGGHNHDFGDTFLEWVNGEAVYYKDIETRYKCPEWVALAVLNQSKKLRTL